MWYIIKLHPRLWHLVHPLCFLAVALPLKTPPPTQILSLSSCSCRNVNGICAPHWWITCVTPCWHKKTKWWVTHPHTLHCNAADGAQHSTHSASHVLKDFQEYIKLDQVTGQKSTHHFIFLLTSMPKKPPFFSGPSSNLLEVLDLHAKVRKIVLQIKRLNFQKKAWKVNTKKVHVHVFPAAARSVPWLTAVCQKSGVCTPTLDLLGIYKSSHSIQTLFSSSAPSSLCGTCRIDVLVQACAKQRACMLHAHDDEKKVSRFSNSNFGNSPDGHKKLLRNTA